MYRNLNGDFGVSRLLRLRFICVRFLNETRYKMEIKKSLKFCLESSTMENRKLADDFHKVSCSDV